MTASPVRRSGPVRAVEDEEEGRPTRPEAESGLKEWATREDQGSSGWPASHAAETSKPLGLRKTGPPVPLNSQ